MIYKISELIATLFEVIGFTAFHICVLSFKRNISVKTKRIGVISLFISQCTLILILDYFYVFEGLLSFLNILLYIVFSIIFLDNKFAYKIIVSLLSTIILFAVDMGVTAISCIVTQIPMKEILLLENPLRIFLLIFTRILFFISLYGAYKALKRDYRGFSKIQFLLITVTLGTLLLIGLLLQKIQIEANIWNQEFSLISCGLIFIIISVILFLFFFTKQNKSRTEYMLMKMQLELQQENMKEIIKNEDSFKKIRHDLRNHLLCIKTYIADGENEKALEYINKIEGNLKKNSTSYFKTNSTVINAILNHKRGICIDNNIDFKCYIIEKLPKIDDMDLCVILSNLLDNAIEAELHEEKPEIKINLMCENNSIRILVQNRISESVLKMNKELKTTKNKKSSHGYGLKNINDTLVKYNGHLICVEEDGWFISDAILYTN